MNTILLLAALVLGRPFGDGMVLQRGVPVPIWGTSDKGAVVEVSFGGAVKTAVVGAGGAWRVDLEPMEASSSPRELVVSAHPADRAAGQSHDRRTLRDVLVGEVWLCSGQSNMEMSLALGRTRYGDGIGMMVAQVTDKPLVRYMKAPGEEGWSRLTPEFLRSGCRSALAVHYALELHEKLGVPVGVIVAACGGSNIDSWNPANGKDAYLYRVRVEPLGPLAIRGAVWYQGETNVTEVDAYPRKLGELHRGWARQFGSSAFPFYFVQLAPYRYGKAEQLAALPAFMEAQASYALSNACAAVTVINDIGNYSDIHPNNKWLVAKRLALHALKRDYGFRDVEDDSPVPVEASVVATNRVRVAFDHAESLYVYRQETRHSLFAEFELAGADGRWQKADIVNFAKLEWTRHGTITNGFVDLVSRAVAEPVRVRYAYTPPFTGVLFNQVNLPCGSFCLEIKRR